MRTLLAAAAGMLAALSTTPTSAQAALCQAQSGPHTTALVELYTSEGCDSCPPADRWLQGLAGRGLAPDRVVPLSLHVNYWDYIGWKDPYAQQRFADRQRKLAQAMKARIVYTPQVLLQGQDFRGWGGRAFDEAVARINARPPKAAISLVLAGGRGHSLEVEAKAELLQPEGEADTALFLATYENRLVSSVSAGENRGRTLSHDYVVFEWLGPISFSGGKAQERRTLPLLPKAVPANSGVAAFVQNRRTAEVLQALMLPACGG